MLVYQRVKLEKLYDYHHQIHHSQPELQKAGQLRSQRWKLSSAKTLSDDYPSNDIFIYNLIMGYDICYDILVPSVDSSDMCLESIYIYMSHLHQTSRQSIDTLW